MRLTEAGERIVVSWYNILLALVSDGTLPVSAMRKI